MTEESNELVLDRLLDAPRDKVFRCWTDPELIKQWFAPKPHTTPIAKLDLRVGGANMIVMKSPEGQEMPNRGTYLEIVPNEKLVFTDAYTGDWQPSGKPFMTVVLTFEDEGGKTRYVGTVRLDPSAKPAAIDFEHTEGPLKGKAWKGIYALDGDTLMVCDNAPNLDKGRPAAFEARSGSGHVLITFQRAKP